MAVVFNQFKSPIEEIIEEARNGRMFVLVDDEDRENEGDIVIPAQLATPEVINIMAPRATSRPRATSFRCSPAKTAPSSALATPKRRSISPAWPGSTPRA